MERGGAVGEMLPEQRKKHKNESNAMTYATMCPSIEAYEVQDASSFKISRGHPSVDLTKKLFAYCPL